MRPCFVERWRLVRFCGFTGLGETRAAARRLVAVSLTCLELWTNHSSGGTRADAWGSTWFRDGLLQLACVSRFGGCFTFWVFVFIFSVVFTLKWRG